MVIVDYSVLSCLILHFNRMISLQWRPQKSTALHFDQVGMWLKLNGDPWISFIKNFSMIWLGVCVAAISKGKLSKNKRIRGKHKHFPRLRWLLSSSFAQALPNERQHKIFRQFRSYSSLCQRMLYTFHLLLSISSVRCSLVHVSRHRRERIMCSLCKLDVCQTSKIDIPDEWHELLYLQPSPATNQSFRYCYFPNVWWVWYVSNRISHQLHRIACTSHVLDVPRHMAFIMQCRSV